MTILDALKQKLLVVSNSTKILTYVGNTFCVTDYSKTDNNIMFTSDESIAVTKLLEETKTCKIINGLYSWRIEVDNFKSVINSSTTDYFDKLYTSLGYIVEFYRESDNGTIVSEPNYRKEIV